MARDIIRTFLFKEYYLLCLIILNGKTSLDLSEDEMSYEICDLCGDGKSYSKDEE